MSQVIDFTKKRLHKQPVQYTVIIRHDHEGMSFTVHDVQDSDKDRKAVAKDLMIAAKSLNE